MNKGTLKTTRRRAQRAGFVIRYDTTDVPNWFCCRANGIIYGVPSLNRTACNRMWQLGELIEVGVIGNGTIYRVNI